MAELVVHPRARRRGIGAAMVRAAYARPAARTGCGRTAPRAGPRDRRRWAWSPSANCVQMRRRCANRRRRDVPEGVRIRTYAGPADDAELLRVNNAAFAGTPNRAAGPKPTSRSGERTLVRSRRACSSPSTRRPSGCSASTGPRCTPTKPGVGEVYMVGVDPAAQGRGLGRALTAVGHQLSARRLADAAEPTVMLYVESDNAAAVRTYRALGFHRVQRRHRLRAYAATDADVFTRAFTYSGGCRLH